MRLMLTARPVRLVFLACLRSFIALFFFFFFGFKYGGWLANDDCVDLLLHGWLTSDHSALSPIPSSAFRVAALIKAGERRFAAGEAIALALLSAGADGDVVDRFGVSAAARFERLGLAAVVEAMSG